MTESRWATGQDEVENLISEGEIEEVEPSDEHAERLLRQADAHLASAPKLLPDDPPGALGLAYDAARKSMAAVLAKQGLRATNKNGHRATQEAIEAQLGASLRHLVRPFRGLRQRRHEAEYPDLNSAPVEDLEAQEAIEDATSITARMRKLVELVGPWRTN